jgi:transposase-like protein
MSFCFNHIMSTPQLSPEIRAKIISPIKDDGMSIADAAKTYNFTEDTIKKWLRASLDNAHTSSSELYRLRREVQQLKEIIGSLMLEREASKQNLPRP